MIQIVTVYRIHVTPLRLRRSSRCWEGPIGSGEVAVSMLGNQIQVHSSHKESGLCFLNIDMTLETMIIILKDNFSMESRYFRMLNNVYIHRKLRSISKLTMGTFIQFNIKIMRFRKHSDIKHYMISNRINQISIIISDMFSSLLNLKRNLIF